MRKLNVRRLMCDILLVAPFFLGAAAPHVLAQQRPFTAQVEIVKPTGSATPSAKEGSADFSNVVVWLLPLDNASTPPAGTPAAQLIQRGKRFEPRVLVVQTGTQVQFPNFDPFFHNVFSLFDGKRFDLGLYESGSSRTIHFDRPGVSFLFCNIHAEMSAAVVSVATPYFGLSDRSGKVTIANVPDGRYRLQLWYERSLPEDLKTLDRTLTLSGSRPVEAIRLMENTKFKLGHKNKYGQDYVPSPTSSY